MSYLTPKNLYIGNGNNTKVYNSSVTANSYTILRNINICNTTANAVTISLHYLPAGTTAASNNAIMSSFALAASETISYDAGIVMAANSSIYIANNVSNACTLTLSGVEFTP